MKKILIGLLVLTSFSAFSQDRSSPDSIEYYTALFEEADRAFTNRQNEVRSNRFDIIAEEADRAFSNSEVEVRTNRYDKIAEEAARAADLCLADRIIEITVVNDLAVTHLSPKEQFCLALGSLDVQLNSNAAKKALKRKDRKKLIRPVIKQKEISNCK